MGAVISFPCKTRVAANDSSPWLSADPLPEPGKAAPVYESPYATRKLITDPVSKIEYYGYIVEKKKPGAGKFTLAVIAWLVFLGIVV